MKQTSRPFGGTGTTSYDIFGTLPRVSGQSPVGEYKRTPLYPWAKQVKRGMSTVNEVYMATAAGYESEPQYRCKMHNGLPPRKYSCTNVSGEGVMLCGSKGGKAEYIFAPGTDTALLLLTTVVNHKLIDEIQQGSTAV